MSTEYEAGNVPPSTGVDGIAGEVDHLETEAVRDDRLEQLTPSQMFAAFVAHEAEAVAAVRAAEVEILPAIKAMVEGWRAGGRWCWFGAGSSGRGAEQQAAELPPTFGTDPERAIAVVAGGEAAKTHSVPGAEDGYDAGAEAVRAMGVGPGDVVFGIAASGRTPYVLGVVETARELGAVTVALVNNPSSPIAAAADHGIVLRTGPEVIVGSTRLAAATAFKVAMGTMTSMAMVRLNRTYKSRMVYMKAAGNKKLQRRALRDVVKLTGALADVAEAALEGAGWKEHVALVMLMADVDASEAVARLRETDGSVAAASAPS